MKNKKRYQQQIALLFGAFAMMSYLAVRYFPGGEETVNVVADVDKSSVQVYLLDESETLVPVTFEMDPAATIQDKMNAAIDRMSGRVTTENFYPLFQEDCLLESVEVTDGTMKLSFNEGFATYDEKNELRVLEALAWTSTQFSDVTNVKLAQKEELSKMPLSGTPIPALLNRDIGINHFETNTTALYNSTEITVYYVKNIGDREFMVPRSKRIEGNEPSTEEIVKEIMADVSVSSGLSQPLYNDNIDVGEIKKSADGILTVNVNANILDSDAVAKAHAYDALVLSLSQIMGVDKVQVCVDDVVVSLHGSNEEAIDVSSLQYNVVAF